MSIRFEGKLGPDTLIDALKAVAQQLDLTQCSEDCTMDEECACFPDHEPRAIDVRLQKHRGTYRLWTGDSSYDTDHRGEWTCATITSEWLSYANARHWADLDAELRDFDGIEETED